MSLLENHFKLHRPPFPPSATPEALLQHQGLLTAREKLLFGLGRVSSIIVLTGESGCGKSTLLGWLHRELDSTEYLLVYSSLTTLGPFSLLSSLSAKLGLRARRFKGDTAQELISHLRSLPRKVVLLIDEAHGLPDASLEDLRLLTGDSLAEASPFHLVLAGQPLLRERLSDPQHYSLAQRVTVRIRLQPLTDSDLALFLDKHLRAAGARRVVFDPDAVTLLFQHSRGIPRLAQNLALHALLAAACAGKKTVDPDCVQQALLEQEEL